MVSKDGIKVDPMKNEAIQNWSRPTSVTNIHSFIKLAGYYWCFVEGFSSIAAPLTQLTLQVLLFVWLEECERIFIRLKELLTTTLILTLPIEGEGFTIYYNASIIGLGYMLMQQGIKKGTLDRSGNIVEPLAEPKRFLHQQRRRAAALYLGP
ncbi:uncharacterized mitochondrial protein AtMg00860-like [Solanum dulcamara]|uniref:uncharacterized mitochondrial protein AtMg00860-like n=1 Tax=Solanum dulcamara TaxID=45834 RepID=UPI0024864CAB|nr:uncharacterized mitochondrial protein AtMg00860-like [Solanum dulcamara]